MIKLRNCELLLKIPSFKIHQRLYTFDRIYF